MNGASGSDRVSFIEIPIILLLSILTFHNLFNVNARWSVKFCIDKRVGFMKEFDQKYAEMEIENLPNTDISCY